MFSGNYNKKYALLMSNELLGCQEDVNRLEKILKNYDFQIFQEIICYPKIELLKFIETIQPKENDLIYIHYSGHGVKRGRFLNDNCEILSAWLNPNKSV